MMIYNQAAYRADMGDDFAGVSIFVSLERQDLTIAGVNRDGTPRVDPSSTKLLREIWPVIRGTPGQRLNIYVGAKPNSTEDTISWQGPFSYTIGQTGAIQPLVEGVFLAIRYESDGEADWSLLGHVLDIEETGEPYR